MKLALVTPNFAPHFEGGTETVVRAHARELAKLGWEITVAAGTDTLREDAEADVLRSRVDALDVLHVPRTRDEFHFLRPERPRIARILERELHGADLVHVHHWTTLHESLVRELGVGRPVVVSLHDLYVTCPRLFRQPPVASLSCPPPGSRAGCETCLGLDAPGFAPEVVDAELERRLAVARAELEGADAVLAPSRAHAATVARHTGLDPKRFQVLEHGVVRELEEGAPAGPGWDGSRPLRVIHFGHRSELKGTLDLVRALAALPAGSVELALAGSEVEAGFDARIAAAAGTLPIRWEGPYDWDALRTLGAWADLAAFPSRAEESYGLVVDEARALGLVVWVSDRGALPERVGDSGQVLPACDPEAWTQAVSEILQNPSRLTRPPKSRLRTARDAAAELDRLYHTLLSQPGTPQ